MPDLATIRSAFIAGKLDVTLNNSWKDYNAITKVAPEVISYAQDGFAETVFRIRCDMEPFTDVRVRQAMLMAVNFEEILDSFFNGFGNPYSPFISPMHPDLYIPFDELPANVKKLLSYDPEGAKALLAEAGYPDGFKTNILYYVNRDPGIAEVLQAYLADIGVEAELLGYDWPVYNSKRLNKEYDAMVMHWNWGTKNPNHKLNVFSDPNHMYNLSKVDDRELQALMDKINVEFDKAKRDPLLTQANLLTIEHAHYFPMPDSTVFNLWWPWLRGYSGEVDAVGHWAFGQLYARLWIDPAMKKEILGN
jgi:ABC-type transport system substrate-binding protein